MPLGINSYECHWEVNIVSISIHMMEDDDDEFSTYAWVYETVVWGFIKFSDMCDVQVWVKL